MNEFFSPFVLFDLPRHADSQDLFKKIYARALIIIGMPISGFFGIHDLFTSRYSGGIISTLIFLALCLLLYNTLKKPLILKPGQLNNIIFRLMLVLLFVFLVYDVGFQHSLGNTAWFLVIPIMTFYSTSFREGLVWTACTGVVLVYFLFFTELNTSSSEINTLKIRLLILFGIIATVTLIANTVLRISIQKLYDKQNQLRVANKNLQDREKKYRLIYNSAPAGIYEYDFIKNRFLAVNDIMCTYSGYTETELLQLNPLDLLTPESKALYKKRTLAQTAGQQIPETVEYDIIKKDGQLLTVLFTSDFTFREGKLSSARVVLHDITERKLIEEELRHARKMETIGTLSSGIAHNFNNLLMGIQGRVSLMSIDLKSDHPHREHADAIQEYIQSAVNLTKQLLGIASDGKIEVKPLDLNALVLESAAMFGKTHKEIQFHTQTQPEPLAVEADRSQIEQVLLNLYLNAWQAMPGGGEIRIDLSIVNIDETVARAQQIEPGDYIKLSVSDTGIGMDKATRQQIFDPFFTTKDKESGTGLGLASAYGIIKNHGGMITVESDIGQGATFNVFLPLSEKETQPEIIPKSEILSGSETCLLVDDEQMILGVGRAMLRKLGYDVITAKSGQEAIDIVADNSRKIDLVILDMIMPGMDGGKTFDRIREIRPQIPVLLSSGYTEAGQAQVILEKGCSGFLQKPFSMAELSQVIRALFNGIHKDKL